MTLLCVRFTILSHFVGSSQVDELLKQRDTIHSSFTVARSLTTSGSSSNLTNGSSSKIGGEDSKIDQSPGEDGGSDGKDKSAKKKWFNLNLKGSDKRLI